MPTVIGEIGPLDPAHTTRRSPRRGPSPDPASLGDLLLELQAIDGAFAGSPFASEGTFDTTTGVEGRPGTAFAAAFAVETVRPNPIRRAADIRYALPHEAAVSLVIFDVAGRRVRTLVDAAMPAGRRDVR